MKLRIRGNSVRLRLGRSEVERASAGEALEQTTRFSPHQTLTTRFEPADLNQPEASFAANRLLVRWPRQAVRDWATSDEVSLRAEQPLPNEPPLLLLVEKDFACLVPRPEEEETDAYPHPNAGTDRC